MPPSPLVVVVVLEASLDVKSGPPPASETAAIVASSSPMATPASGISSLAEPNVAPWFEPHAHSVPVAQTSPNTAVTRAVTMKFYTLEPRPDPSDQSQLTHHDAVEDRDR